jgi:hypothetical protein
MSAEPISSVSRFADAEDVAFSYDGEVLQLRLSTGRAGAQP